MQTAIRVLHTSDWHLGRLLYGKRRAEVFADMLSWLLKTLKEEAIDVLLVSGDIYDNGTPSAQAQKLYYDFLGKASKICQHIVVTAGNHDSALLLNASGPVLEAINVHVVAMPSNDISDEVLVLNSANDEPQLIVCAVPYLRDRDVRNVFEGESIEQKEQNLQNGICQHFEAVFTCAKAKQKALSKSVPIIAMGHLFTAGGQVLEDDGVRELYVGNLARIHASIFPDFLDYVALGHLHIAQRVEGHDHIRYCGSPVAMGFGEAKQQKVVCKVTLSNGQTQVEDLPVPVFQQMQTIRGDWPEIQATLLDLKAKDVSVWVEVVYTGEQIQGNLREEIETLVDHSKIEVLRITNQRVLDKMLQATVSEEQLEDLDPFEVFDRCLDAHEVPENQRPVLKQAYHEVMDMLKENKA